MKLFATALLGASLLSVPANASDIFGGSTKDPVTTGPSYSGGVVNWTGIYIGGQFGWLNANHNLFVDPVLDLDGLNSSGLIGGGRIGFDVARGRFLVGVFGDYNFTDAETSLEISGTGITYEKDDEWTLGVRAGYIVAPKTLPYALIGYTETGYDFVTPSGGASFDYDGVTGGVGIEFAAASNVFLGLEATHTWYGDETLADLGRGFDLPSIPRPLRTGGLGSGGKKAR
jgi:opacity protein-like surface antigen